MQTQLHILLRLLKSSIKNKLLKISSQNHTTYKTQTKDLVYTQVMGKALPRKKPLLLLLTGPKMPLASGQLLLPLAFRNVIVEEEQRFLGNLDSLTLIKKLKIL